MSQFYLNHTRRQYFGLVDETERVLGGAGFAEYNGSGEIAELQKLYLAEEAKGKGYGGDVGVMVGFNVANDTLAGIGTTTLKETPGLGMRIAEPGFTGQFRGIAAPVGLKSQGGSIDGISGATISSSGAVTAVNLAAEAYKALKPEILKTWGNK